MSSVTIRRIAYAAVGLLAVAVRWSVRDVRSLDFTAFLSGWWTFLDQNGHLAALKDASFSNYNTPYLVLLALATYLPVPAIIAIKAISTAFDILLAITASRISAAVRPGSAWLPFATFTVVLLLPTVMMNSGLWAQCDSIYATFCLASILSLVRGRPWGASLWFGVAFAFKLQALFLLPVLVGVVIVNRLRVRTLLAVPVSFVACLVPALLAGRSLLSQLDAYRSQLSDPSGVPQTPGGGSSPASSSLTHNAPTPYAWLPAWPLLLYVGLAVTALVVLGVGVWLILRKKQLGPSEIVLVAATAALLVPLLLPHMHDRYFYLAEVLLVVASVVDRRYVLPAVGIQIASISTYLTFLAGMPLMPLQAAAGFAVAAGVAAAALLVRALKARPATVS